jgi:outer membrane murein-binding lipoprotein Lpp
MAKTMCMLFTAVALSVGFTAEPSTTQPLTTQPSTQPESSSATVAQLQQTIRALREELKALQAENARLRSQLAAKQPQNKPAPLPQNIQTFAKKAEAEIKRIGNYTAARAASLRKEAAERDRRIEAFLNANPLESSLANALREGTLKPGMPVEAIDLVALMGKALVQETLDEQTYTVVLFTPEMWAGGPAFMPQVSVVVSNKIITAVTRLRN